MNTVKCFKIHVRYIQWKDGRILVDGKSASSGYVVFRMPEVGFKMKGGRSSCDEFLRKLFGKDGVQDYRIVDFQVLDEDWEEEDGFYQEIAPGKFELMDPGNVLRSGKNEPRRRLRKMSWPKKVVLHSGCFSGKWGHWALVLPWNALLPADISGKSEFCSLAHHRDYNSAREKYPGGIDVHVDRIYFVESQAELELLLLGGRKVLECSEEDVQEITSSLSPCWRNNMEKDVGICDLFGYLREPMSMKWRKQGGGVVNWNVWNQELAPTENGMAPTEFSK